MSTTTDPKLQETAERFHMAMAEAGYPDVVARVRNGVVSVEYPLALEYEGEKFQRAFYMASKLCDPEAEMACFDCWFAAQHTHHDGKSCDVHGCDETLGTTCPHV